jgi:hypothetical protein
MINEAYNISSIDTHYRKQLISRVPGTLPCAISRALDKQLVCRVSSKRHSAKLYTWQQNVFTKCQKLGTLGKQRTHGKESLCRVLGLQHMAKGNVCRVPTADTRQSSCPRWHHGPPLDVCRVSTAGTRLTYSLPSAVQPANDKEFCLPSVHLWHSANFFFCFFPPKLFLLLTYNTYYSMLKFCIFVCIFTIFPYFISVKGIFGNFPDLNCKCFEY